MRRELSSVLLVGATLALGACSNGDTSSGRESAALGSTSQAIVNGTSSVKAQDFVVQIAIKKDTRMIPHCTGTMIAKNLVITARHCVGELNATEVSITDYEPSKLAFYTGTDAGPKTVDKDPEAHGAQLFVNGKKNLVPDIALVMLDKELDLPIAPVRLDGGAMKGEALDIIGYGLTQKDEYPLARQQRKGVTIVKTGPGRSELFDLLAGEFQFGEAACAGDSGGPAISAKTGALVGIASRVSNGTERSTVTPSSFCIGKTAEDIYTDLTPAKAFIDAAFEAAGTTPWIEGDDSPEEKKAAAEAAAAADAKAAADRKTAAGAAAAGCNAGRTTSSPDAAFLAVAAAIAISARRRRAR